MAYSNTSSIGGLARTVAFVALVVGMMLDLIDGTILNVAIPTIQSSLGASYADIQWMIAGYSLPYALLLITSGRLGDIFGYKRMFLCGVAGFTAASLLSGIAPTAWCLILARIIQGSMAALMMPQTISLLQLMYTPDERGRLFGILGMLGGLAAAIGPVIGGLLVHANIFGLSWRMVFFVNILVGLVALIAGWRLLPANASSHPPKLDLTGTFLLVIALGFLIFPLIEGPDLSWPGWITGMLLAAIPSFVIFIRHQTITLHRHGSALIVPSLFKHRSFVSGCLLNVATELALIAIMLVLTITFQKGFRLDVLPAALLSVPLAIGIGLGSFVISDTLTKKMGRYVVTIGTLIVATGLIAVWYIIRQYDGAMLWWLIVPLLAAGVGMSLLMAPSFAIALRDVPAKYAGAASGTLQALQQIGTAAGVVLVGFSFLAFVANDTPAEYMSAFSIAMGVDILLLLGVGILSFSLPRQLRASN